MTQSLWYVFSSSFFIDLLLSSLISFKLFHRKVSFYCFCIALSHWMQQKLNWKEIPILKKEKRQTNKDDLSILSVLRDSCYPSFPSPTVTAWMSGYMSPSTADSEGKSIQHCSCRAKIIMRSYGFRSRWYITPLNTLPQCSQTSHFQVPSGALSPSLPCVSPALSVLQWHHCTVISIWRSSQQPTHMNDCSHPHCSALLHSATRENPLT